MANGTFKLPGTIAGIEGSGQIVEVGSEEHAHFINKKVVFGVDFLGNTEGTWTQFFLIDLDHHHFLVFDDSAEYQQIACAFFNPLTALGLVDVVNKANHKAIVIDAAASALSKMIIKLSKQNDIPIIGIVRKQDHVEELLNQGATSILNSSSPSFDQEFQKVVQELKPTVFLDCIGGDFPSAVLKNMPEDTQVIQFGFLSGKPMAESITKSDRYSFFRLPEWIKGLPKEDLEFYKNLVKIDISGEGKTFGTQILKEYPLTEWQKAYEESGTIASEGKILIRPQL